MALRPSSESAQSSKSSNKSPLSIHFLTLFPEIFPPVLQSSLLGKAQERGLAEFSFTQIRDFAKDRHHTVDDTPYGGGEGMVLKADVLYDAWKSVSEGAWTVLLSPQGKLLDQEFAKGIIASHRKIVLVCGHYEGVDERFIELCVDQELSIGDYVLTGGELPALVVADILVRLVPGVVGKEGSVLKDSLEGDLLKYPQYTRPAEFMGRAVPKVLLSGNHQEIARWREERSRERTSRKRPDLVQKKS